jgi:formylglycine-generating enzyme required for sulfatase activity
MRSLSWNAVSGWRLCGLVALVAVMMTVPLPGADGARSGTSTSLDMNMFDLGMGCLWIPQTSSGVRLRMNDHYIARPAEGEDRDAWLAAMREYRQQVREGKISRNIEMTFTDNRAWIRLANSVTKAYDFRPGEKIRMAIDARWMEGNNNLVVAFDTHTRAGYEKVGWTGVVTTVPIPKDGQWHRLETEIVMPQFDADELLCRPVFGMDIKIDRTPGQVEIRGVSIDVDDPGRMNAVKAAVEDHLKKFGPLDRSLYDREDLRWAAGMYTLHFSFMYDSSFYNVQTGEYTLDAFLDDGLREFGGYDAIMLWQAYPRLGVDERNQFDMMRDMPGGFDGIRELVHRAHARGTRVLANYNPWDLATHEGEMTDIDVDYFTFKPFEGDRYGTGYLFGYDHTYLPKDLLDQAAATEVDGFFLDTMLTGSFGLRQRVDEIRPGLAFIPEAHPPIEQLAISSGSWAQHLNDFRPPGILHLKWIEPRHMQNQIRRWDLTHDKEIEIAFFNGSGMIIWENIFGTYNPRTIEDRLMWRRAVSILRHFNDNFTNEAWDPHYPTTSQQLFANRWPGEDATLFTLLNYGDATENGALMEMPAESGVIYFDLWNGERLQPEMAGRNVRIVSSIDRIGCIVAIDENKIDAAFKDLVAQQRQKAQQEIPRDDARNFDRSVVHADPVAPTRLQRADDPPAGMVLVPRTTFNMKLKHVRQECACYPDPGTPQEKRQTGNLWGNPFYTLVTHDIGPIEVQPFFIDEAEVTNARFKEFLDESGYRPRHTKNFLKHWPAGTMPAKLADHPVVYVDIDDARAYAKWAGKRLPTEPEWHLAAQGTDGRTWPWGNEFDADKCNTTGDRTMPVKSYPAGKSPFGCYNMSGNVWEWTESCRDDGRTRFVIIRGGSYFDASDVSIWFVRGGPQPCTSHAKFIRMWPGLDRCSTIGFRCVVDAK